MDTHKIYRLLGRTLGKSVKHEHFAQNAIILHPEEAQDVPAGVYLREHLHRITGVTINCELDVTMERMQQRHFVHAPTILYAAGRTRLFGGGMWTCRNEFLTRRISFQDNFAPVNLKQAVVVDSDVAIEYFGHWLREVFPSSLVATAEMPALCLKRPSFFHGAGYQQALGLKTIYANRGMVENLFLLSDFSQNSYKLARYNQLRTNIKAKINPQSIPHRGVFIARGSTGSKRALLNEEAVIDYLQKRGFDVIHPEKMSAEEIVRRTWDAPMVITVEGSNQNHAIYTMARKGSLLILQPPQRFGIIIKGACDCMGLGWGFYVCAPANDGEGFYLDNFDDLQRVMDGLQARS